MLIVYFLIYGRLSCCLPAFVVLFVLFCMLICCRLRACHVH